MIFMRKSQWWRMANRTNSRTPLYRVMVPQMSRSLSGLDGMSRLLMRFLVGGAGIWCVLRPEDIGRV